MGQRFLIKFRVGRNVLSSKFTTYVNNSMEKNISHIPVCLRWFLSCQTCCKLEKQDCCSPTQISLDDGGNINTGLRIYTDGSKTERGVGAAFYVLTDVNITHRWSTRLSLRNTVFQAEILALLKAVEHAVSFPTQQLTILVDNEASINSAANPKSHNSIARKIFKLLHSHPHIKVSWIKAHAGYIGNEEADRLAKEAAETENFPETSFIKTFLRQKMLATWQMAWDDGDTHSQHNSQS
ncbi:hypothetical protein AVEN_211382-1 [Araneus ventricosus]|uniref:ribonuclease H n=1 Tax=Araneus ventricosus TaxID=182803 RepID=A0A4Y2NXD7_ARAVE|nr:hypothetical protein AVEN_211382-1 [Araneus ventricosus]